ncbi:MAG: serine/threonine protein phosphatase [Gemmatimonadetes bacterium]|nr:serine/threonine protein phosphatase [Gemmatimonadota bacterium]
MRALAFSDVHRDEAAARDLARRAADADVLVGAGDLATMRAGLQPVVDLLAASTVPVILVPGNGESFEELAAACRPHGHLHPLHGNGVEIGGQSFFGLGGGIPVTPFGSWSWDLTEQEAEVLLAGCPEGGVLISHSPPHGTCDQDRDGIHLGSRAVREAIVRTRPQQVVCGHIHASWGQEGQIGPTPVLNAGPRGRLLDL